MSRSIPSALCFFHVQFLIVFAFLYNDRALVARGVVDNNFVNVLKGRFCKISVGMSSSLSTVIVLSLVDTLRLVAGFLALLGFLCALPW